MKRRKLFRRRKKRRKSSFKGLKKFIALVILIGVVILGSAVTKSLNKALLPTMTAMTEIEVSHKVNKAIFEGTNSSIGEKDLSSADFYKRNIDSDGMVRSISVNTFLVNELCGKIALSVSEQLMDIESQTIYIPLGVLFGVETLANIGPNLKVSVLPLGDARVEYETKFESVGINQINFQIWLNIKTSVRVVNPLQSNVLDVTKKISLVNTVFSGDVPNMYFEGSLHDVMEKILE